MLITNKTQVIVQRLIVHVPTLAARGRIKYRHSLITTISARLAIPDQVHQHPHTTLAIPSGMARGVAVPAVVAS